MLPGEAGGTAASSALDRQTWRSVATMGADAEVRAVVEQACQPVRQRSVQQQHDEPSPQTPPKLCRLVKKICG